MKPYEDRLAEYEFEKARLRYKSLTPQEYEKELQKVINKLKLQGG